MGFSINKLGGDDRLESGVWLNQDGEVVGEENPSDLEMLIAPMNSRAYSHAVSRYLAKNRRQLRRLSQDNADPEANERSTIEGIVEAVLLDWRHLEDSHGKDIPYSKDKARELLRENYDFLQLVSDLGLQVALMRREHAQDAEKNSETVSAGKSSGRRT